MTAVGEAVNVRHSCAQAWNGLPSDRVIHTSPITVTKRTRTGDGWRLSGIRCDGTAIEWIEGDEL